MVQFEGRNKLSYLILSNCFYFTKVVLKDEEYVPEYIDAGERLPHLPLVVIKQEKPEVGMHMQKCLEGGGRVNPTTMDYLFLKDSFYGG